MPFDAQGKWIAEDDSTANQLNKLTASDSPYIAQARAAGQTVANKRGLLNSSIAAGASEGAAISAALPIASQDASQIATKNNNLLSSGYAMDQQKAADAAALDRLNVQNAATAGLAKDTAGYDMAKLAASNAAAAALAKDAAGYDLTKITTQGTIDTDRQKIATASADKNAALSATLQANQNYLTAFSALADNKDIPAATRDEYIQHLLDTRSTGLDMVQQVYGIDLNWAGKTAATDGTPSAYTPVAAVAPAGVKASDFTKEQLAQAAANAAAYGGSGGGVTTTARRVSA